MKNLYLLYCLIILLSCSFLSHPKLLKQFTLKDGTVIGIYVVYGSATTNDAIIIERKSNYTSTRVDFFERYNFLDSSRLLNDTTLLIVVKDSGIGYSNPADTFNVNLNQVNK